MIVNVQKEKDIIHPVAYEDEDFSVYVEDNTIGCVLHCYVRNWSKTVYDRMLTCLTVIVNCTPDKTVYAFSNNKKLTKFATMFGMESIDALHNNEGEEIGELLCLTL